MKEELWLQGSEEAVGQGEGRGGDTEEAAVTGPQIRDGQGGRVSGQIHSEGCILKAELTRQIKTERH